MNRSKKDLSAKALIAATYDIFKNIRMPQVKGKRKEPITITDCLMSGLAIFSLKYPSLLRFDEDIRNEETIRHNLRSLYKVNNAPSDTYMRERLDEVDPDVLRAPFKANFARLQRAGIIKSFQYFNGFYLLSIDGTGVFSSHKVHCQNCCVKEHKNGTVTYYHQTLTGVLVHPSIKQVIPFAPEPIMKCDGNEKNDCEFNAFKRFITDFRKEHPHLKVIILADGLFSKGPILTLLKELRIHYIIGAKQGDHKNLYEFALPICSKYELTTPDEVFHEFSYTNKVPLNDANKDFEVNFLDYYETDEKGGKTRFTWITDLKLTTDTVYKIMKGGRARWKIENETFNTLKTQEYNFEHNFGHGQLYLHRVFTSLMMLAFSIDQIQAFCDPPFQKALLKQLNKPSRLWRALRNLFINFTIDSWDDIWNAIIYKKAANLKDLIINSDGSS